MLKMLVLTLPLQENRPPIAPTRMKMPGVASTLPNKIMASICNISTLQMVSTQSVASRYAELVTDKKLRTTIFKLIVGEHERTVACLRTSRARKNGWRQTRCWRARSRTAFRISIC
jgi:hypothetical protein